MNYIKRLQAENEALAARLAAVQAELTAARAYLTTPKFVGVESDGSRKDWIATGDVDRMLNTISEAGAER